MYNPPKKPRKNKKARPKVRLSNIVARSLLPALNEAEREDRERELHQVRRNLMLAFKAISQRVPGSCAQAHNEAAKKLFR